MGELVRTLISRFEVLELVLEGKEEEEKQRDEVRAASRAEPNELNKRPSYEYDMMYQQQPLG